MNAKEFLTMAGAVALGVVVALQVNAQIEKMLMKK